MSYIGKEPQYTDFPSKFFNGDGTAMTVTLDYSPPNPASLLVFIDGVRQDTSAYTISGYSLTFTGTVPSGTNNVQVVHMGMARDVNVPALDSVSTASIQDGAVTSAKLDTNIAIDGDLTVDTNTLYVDSTNNRVGVGLNTPSASAHIRTDEPKIILQIAGNSGYNTIESDVGNEITFGRSGTEHMRIDSGGNLLVGTTSTGGVTGGSSNGAYISGDNTSAFSRSTTNNRAQISFYNPNGLVGQIGTSGSSTYYNTSSDYRLKEDWQLMSGSIDRLKALNPVNFAWKVDGSRADGFLAHEVQEVVFEAISGNKDGMRTEEYEITPAAFNDEGVETTAAVMGTREVPEYQGIDQSKLVPLLTSALQEAVAKIESLEARVAALEAN